MLDIQRSFLQRYKNYRADTYRVLDELGIEFAHLLAWRETIEFDLEFRKATRQILLELRQESFLNAQRRIHDVLLNGVQTVTYNNSWRQALDKEGSIVELLTSRKTVKKSEAPIEYIRLALQESSIAKAITELANEGVLPETIARKIIQRTETITQDMIDCFEIDNDVDQMTERKAIALIKEAVLGTQEDVG